MAKKEATKEVANWDEELARAAKERAQREAGASGVQYFSTQGGILSYGDADMPGNAHVCVIVSSILERVRYESGFKEGELTPPVCFSFSRDPKNMVPHRDVVERGQQCNDTCRGCQYDVFGSAETGRGKGCVERRRLMTIPAGVIKVPKNGGMEIESVFEDPDHFQSAPLTGLKVPVMSIKGYANYTQFLDGKFGRPEFGVYTLIRIVQDKKANFKIEFEAVDPVKLPNEIIPVIMDRVKEADAVLDACTHNLDGEEPEREEAPKKGAKKSTTKTGASKRKY